MVRKWIVAEENTTSMEAVVNMSIMKAAGRSEVSQSYRSSS